MFWSQDLLPSEDHQWCPCTWRCGNNRRVTCTLDFLRSTAFADWPFQGAVSVFIFHVIFLYSVNMASVPV